MFKLPKIWTLLVLVCFQINYLKLFSQGNRLSIQCSSPQNLSVCGVFDTLNIEVYNISFSPVNSIVLNFNLPPGIFYIENSINGSGVSQNNITNKNQPTFNLPNLGIAQNVKFKILIKAECDIVNYIKNNVPIIGLRANYSGNYDLGNSNPFTINVPSLQIVSITNVSITTDLNSKFTRKITIGNFGKGNLREIVLKRINQKDVSLFYSNNGNNIFNGDTITTIIKSEQFKKIGNSDSLFNQNETIEIVDSFLVKGCLRLSTSYELSWGCGGNICNTVKQNASIIISNKTPNIVGIPVPTYPSCYDSFFYSSDLKITNNGTWISKNNKVFITQYYTLMTRFDTSSVRIKKGYKGSWIKPKIDSTVIGYNSSYYACLGSNPITAYRVVLPDILPGDTFYINWNTFSCVSNVCVSGFSYGSWYYITEYFNQCNNKVTSNLAGGRGYYTNSISTSNYGPTDLINNQVGTYRTLISSANFLYTGTAKPTYLFELVLPAGLKHNLNKSDFYLINSDLDKQWDPDSVVKRGDTIRAFFPHPIPISLVNAELVFKLKADCSITGANGNKIIKLIIRYENNSNCKKKENYFLTCQNITTKLHCSNSCNGGMKFTDFSVNRINYGLADNDNDGIPDQSGNLDSSKIRTERVLFGDTIETVMIGRVVRRGSTTNFRFLFTENNITYGNFYSAINAQILVYRAGNQRMNCTRTIHQKIVSGNNANFKFQFNLDSLGSCVPNNFTYRHNDSVVIKIKYKNTINLGGTSVVQIYSNLFYLSDIANPTSNNNKFQCDTFSGQTILTGYYFTNWGPDNFDITNCNLRNISQNYYLGIGPCCSNYGGNNYFPYEYRNFAQLRFVRLYLPNGYKWQQSYINQSRTAGSNKVKTEFKDTILPLNTNTFPLVFDISKFYKDSSAGRIQKSDDGFHGTFLATVKPTCEISPNIFQNIRYDMIFERKGSFGNGFDTISSGTSDDRIRYNLPVTIVKPISNIVYATEDTAEWKVTYTNMSTTFSNENTWFAADNSGAVKIVQIKDADKDTFIKQTNGIFRVGNIGFNKTRKFKVRGIYNTCNRDSVILFSGWNCEKYPTDLNNYQCQKDRMALYVEPQNTQVQVSIIDSIRVANLCAQTPYSFILNNIGKTKVYNLKPTVTLPTGMEIISGSCFIQFPHKSSKKSIPLPVNLYGNVFQWNLNNIDSIFKKGFIGITDTNKNKIIITFKVKTNCDYSSGSYLRATATGNINCGQSALFYSSIGKPLDIVGVTRPYYSYVKVINDSILPCSTSTKNTVTIINLGPSKTGIQDKYQVLLPIGSFHDSSLFLAQRNAPSKNTIKTKVINGQQEIEFSLLDNISPGDSMVFEFGYTSTSNKINCGKIDLYSQSVVKQQVLCVADNSYCNINVITGDNLSEPIVEKASLELNNLRAKLQSMSSDSEVLFLEFDLKNSGKKIILNNQLKYKIYYDKDNSGTINSFDELLSIDSLSQNIATNQSITLNKILKVKPGQSCALYIQIDSSVCSCLFPSSKFPIPFYKNAGNNFEICSQNKGNLGIEKINGFKYFWTPNKFINWDTLANPLFNPINNTPNQLIQNYILTTNRGFCSSKDTIEVKINSLPYIKKLQNDTAICYNQSVNLKINALAGTGNKQIKWQPAYLLSDSTLENVFTKNLTTNTFFVEIIDTKNCKANDSINVIINSLPKANFNFIKVCHNDYTKIFDSSFVINDVINYKKWFIKSWDTLNVNNFNYSIDNNLKTDVKLIVSTPNNCADTTVKEIFVYENPVANFDIDNICQKQSFYTKNKSSYNSLNIVKNNWYIDDIFQKDSLELIKKMNIFDTFEIKLVVENSKNCKDTFSKKLIVFPLPNVDFTVNNHCLNDSSKFINLSSIPKDSIIKYEWKNDLFYSNNINYTHLINKDSVYNIKLVATSNYFCKDSISKNFEIYPNPKADFEALPVCETKTSLFNDKSFILKNTLNFWKYTVDGNQIFSQNTSYKFNIGDTFPIQLIVGTNRNCFDTIAKNHIVYPKISPLFNYYNICLSDSFRTSENSIFYNTNIKNLAWNIDNKNLTNKNLTYKFTNWGLDKPIKLTVTSLEGCQYDTTFKINVYPLPKINFWDTNQCVDNQFNFTNLSDIDYGNITNFFWDFGDNTNSTSQNPYHKFNDANKYFVKLIAQSDQSCFDSLTKLIQSFPPVLVDFSFDNVCDDFPVIFKNKSNAPLSTIIENKWTFGNGKNSILENPIHIYPTFGNYSANLKVKTAYNCYYDTTKIVTIFENPKADFSLDKDITTILDPKIEITDQSYLSDDVIYTLGDGNKTNLRNLIHLYQDSGIYFIKQVVKTNNGCSDSIVKKFVVKYLFVFNTPTAFTPNDDATNEVLKPEGLGITTFEMQIFNRWGELIFKGNENEGWDGKYKDELVQEGHYMVVYKVKDFKGRFHYLKTSVLVIY